MSRRARFLTPLGWALLTAWRSWRPWAPSGWLALEMPDAAGDLLAGLALLVGGAAAWAKRPGSRSGPLSVLAGVAWFAGDLTDVLLYAHRGPLVHLLLTYPSGRVDSRAAAVVISAAYVDGLVPEPRSEWPDVALMAAVLTVAAWRHSNSSAVERRARAARRRCRGDRRNACSRCVRAWRRRSGCGRGRTYYAAVALTAAGLSADLLWGRWTRAAVTGSVVDLGDRFEPDALRARSRAAWAILMSRSPTAWRCRRLGRRGGTGRAVPDGEGRAVTLADEGEAVAALVHDPAALADRELVDSVAAAARLAVVNVRLQAEIAAHRRRCRLAAPLGRGA